MLTPTPAPIPAGLAALAARVGEPIAAGPVPAVTVVAVTPLPAPEPQLPWMLVHTPHGGVHLYQLAGLDGDPLMAEVDRIQASWDAPGERDPYGADGWMFCHTYAPAPDPSWLALAPAMHPAGWSPTVTEREAAR